nr:MAG TPA: tail protein [Caudoviricetes sp.]
MEFFCSKCDGTLVGVLNGVTMAKRCRSVDGSDTLDITCSNCPVTKGDRIVFTDGQGIGAEYLVQSVQAVRGEEQPTITIQCSNSVAELSSVYVEDLRGTAATAEARFKDLLAGTRWDVGYVENGSPETAQGDYAFYHTNVLKAIQATCKTFGLEFYTSVELDGNHIVSRKINAVEQRGEKTSLKRFEYSRDLKSIKRTVNAANVITRLYVWGKSISQGEQKTEDGETVFTDSEGFEL